MLLGFLAGAILYGAITLYFLITSSCEVLESGLSTPARLFGVLLTAVFWPVTLIVLSLIVFVSSPGNYIVESDGRVSYRLSN